MVCCSFPAHLAFVCLENISLHFDDTADQRDLKDSVTFFSGSPAMGGLCMSAGLMFLGRVADCKIAKNGVRCRPMLNVPMLTSMHDHTMKSLGRYAVYSRYAVYHRSSMFLLQYICNKTCLTLEPITTCCDCITIVS